jgi:hypothetical protein
VPGLLEHPVCHLLPAVRRLLPHRLQLRLVHQLPAHDPWFFSRRSPCPLCDRCVERAPAWRKELQPHSRGTPAAESPVPAPARRPSDGTQQRHDCARVPSGPLHGAATQRRKPGPAALRSAVSQGRQQQGLREGETIRRPGGESCPWPPFLPSSADCRRLSFPSRQHSEFQALVFWYFVLQFESIPALPEPRRLVLHAHWVLGLGRARAVVALPACILGLGGCSRLCRGA